MRITRKIIWFWLLLFIPFFCFKLYKGSQANENYEKSYSSAVNMYVGSKFTLDKFIDSNGTDAKIDVGKSELTVVDFWFKDCPPCLRDMKRYSLLIQGKEQQINVTTVCVNRFDLWKPLLHSSEKRFAMLSRQMSNWKHLVLKSNEDPRLRNDIPMDNGQLMENTFQSTNFPMYFVLDRDGIIKATPTLLSKYIEIQILHRNPFLYYLTDVNTWTADYFFVPSTFVEYSGYFWIVTIVILSIFNFKRRNKNQAS